MRTIVRDRYSGVFRISKLCATQNTVQQGPSKLYTIALFLFDNGLEHAFFWRHIIQAYTKAGAISLTQTSHHSLRFPVMLSSLLLLFLYENAHRHHCETSFRNRLNKVAKKRRYPIISRTALQWPSEAPVMTLFMSRNDQALLKVTALDHDCFQYCLTGLRHSMKDNFLTRVLE